MNADLIRIRPASSPDVPVITRFNIALALESENKRLDEGTVQRGVTRGFLQGAEVQYFLAEDSAGQPVGQLMLTREWSDWRDGWIMWIQSVYVRPEWRGQGVFRSLLKAAIDAMKRQPDVVGVRLYVEVANDRAQVVYLRSGFVDASYRVLEMMFNKS